MPGKFASDNAIGVSILAAREQWSMADYINVTSLNRLAKAACLPQCEPLNDLIVCGEISGFVRHYKSGHMYFTLKDENRQRKKRDVP